MKKKFGGYTIHCDKARLIPTTKSWNGKQNYELRVELWGNIEIGIEVDKWTWRGDWILAHAFKENAHNYRITKIEQHNFYEDHIEHNQITAQVEAC